jgi:hypothetical protein
MSGDFCLPGTSEPVLKNIENHIYKFNLFENMVVANDLSHKRAKY